MSKIMRSTQQKTDPPAPPSEARVPIASVPPVSTKSQRVLTPEQIKVRRGHLIKQWEDKEKERLLYVEQNKIEFFKPIEPYQSKIFELIHGGKSVIALHGANGIGKTVLGSVVVGSACLGIQPWDKGDTRWGRRAVRARIICSDWEKHAETVIVPKLKEWLPLGQYSTTKNNLGVESVFTFRNGSTIELITNKQATMDHAGWQGDIIWGDEPFDEDKFVENLRGLRNPDGKGLFLLTFTATSQSWMLDRIVLNTHPSYASVTEIPIFANPTLTKEYIEMFTASMTEDQKVARIHGGWLNLVGLVWKGFKPDVHMIDDFVIPVDWPVVPMIDWHTNKPIAVSFYAVDQRNMTYVIDEIWENGSAEEIADKIIRKKRLNSWRIQEAFIDPLSKGDTAYVKNMGIEVKDSFNRLKDALWNERIDLKVATKDKDSGIRNVEDMLKGINGLPSLYFFRTALSKINREGHIFEIQRWTYDDNGKPRDEADHFMENLYRVTLTGVRYTTPSHSMQDLKSEIDFDIFAERNMYA